jgi:adenosylcobinamide-GDP ribazoletransferase
MRLYFIAMQFLTIIPLPFRVRCDEHDLGRSMALFPLAGLTIGLLLAGGDFLAARLLPRPVADLLLIVALSAVTGALHLDGLADVCDGLAARGGRERFLAVMKDSRIGAVGVVGLVLGLLLKYQALLHVPPDLKRQALLLFPMVARFAQVQAAVGARSAREQGLGALFLASAGWRELLVAFITSVALAWLLMGIQGLMLLGTACFFTWLLKGWFHQQLGGITGDVIGCISELNEILCLLLILGIASGR